MEAAINLLAPHLFPLITAVEEKVSGTRAMPTLSSASPPGQQPRGDRYELTGRVDVISSVSLAQQQGNPLVQLIQTQTPGLGGQFDVIVDYKAARGPPTLPRPGTKSHWQHEALQVQLYAWLRSQQPQTQPVRGGILVYVNEMSPSLPDIALLRDEVLQKRTDVAPVQGDPDYYALFSWHPGQTVPNFSPGFLLRRAVRIVPVGPADIGQALTTIDDAVADIEQCVMRENATGDIPRALAGERRRPGLRCL